jgi:hypothetical protein
MRQRPFKNWFRSSRRVGFVFEQRTIERMRLHSIERGLTASKGFKMYSMLLRVRRTDDVYFWSMGVALRREPLSRL